MLFYFCHIRIIIVEPYSGGLFMFDSFSFDLQLRLEINFETVPNPENQTIKQPIRFYAHHRLVSGAVLTFNDISV